MPRTINEFISSMSKAEGFARLAQFEVEISLPPWVGDQGPWHPGSGTASTSPSQHISLLCNSISLPGHDLQTHSAKYGTGLETMMVNGHGYEGTIAATFYIDENHNTKAYFEIWQHMAVNNRTHKARYYKDNNGNFNYAGKMQIFQLGGSGRTAGMEVEEVYPVTVGQIEYAYETTDTLALLPVEFQYRKWKTMDPRKLDKDGRGR